jgi:hypothetical protein
MNLPRLALAAVAATIVYFVAGGISFVVLPLADEFRKYPLIYRTQESMKSVIPMGMIAMLLAISAITVIYSMLGRHSIATGALFGALIGVFAVGSFVIHNYVNLNIGLTLTLQQAVAYFVEWTLVGIVIGSIYRPR